MLKIKRINILAMSKVFCVLYALFGLIIGSIMTLMALTGAQPAPGSEGTNFGIASIIVFPLLYALIGFISGAVTAYLFNMTTQWVGPLEFETSE